MFAKGYVMRNHNKTIYRKQEYNICLYCEEIEISNFITYYLTPFFRVYEVGEINYELFLHRVDEEIIKKESSLSLDFIEKKIEIATN